MQTANRQRVRIQRHDAELVGRQVGFPGAAHRLRTGDLFRIGQVGFIHLRQTPDLLLRVKRRARSIAYRLQTALVVKRVDANPAQLGLAFHPLDVDKAVTVFRPQTLLGREQRAAVHLLRTVVTRHLFTLRCDPFANGHRQQHQRNRGFHHRQRHLHTGKARSLHHHQFTALGQHAQPQQCPQQRRHREEDLDIFRRTEQGIQPGAHRIVAPLPGFFQLVNELDDPGERHQHEQRHHDGGENGFTDIAVKYTKRLHYTAPLRIKRARKRRIGTVSQRLSTIASAR